MRWRMKVDSIKVEGLEADMFEQSILMRGERAGQPEALKCRFIDHAFLDGDEATADVAFK